MTQTNRFAVGVIRRFKLYTSSDRKIAGETSYTSKGFVHKYIFKKQKVNIYAYVSVCA